MLDLGQARLLALPRRSCLTLVQFERFKRVFATPSFQPLLSHESCVVLSTLVFGDDARQRVFVRGPRPRETAFYTMTLKRRLGGLRDGVWFTKSLRCDSLGGEAAEEGDGGHPPPKLYSS